MRQSDTVLYVEVETEGRVNSVLEVKFLVVCVECGLLPCDRVV